MMTQPWGLLALMVLNPAKADRAASWQPRRRVGRSAMSAAQTALVVGGTGQTGARVLERLLSCGIRVRAVVRSADRLPKGAAQDPRLGSARLS